MVLSKTSFGQAAENINPGGTTGETSHVVQKGRKLYAYHPRSVSLPILVSLGEGPCHSPSAVLRKRYQWRAISKSMGKAGNEIPKVA